MKKIFILSLFLISIFVVSGCELVQQNPQLAMRMHSLEGGGSSGEILFSCTDYDGGLDYYTASYAEGYGLDGGWLIINDGCIESDGYNDGWLREAKCINNIPTFQDYECQNGCYEGRCLQQDEFGNVGVIDLLNGAQIVTIGDCTSSEGVAGDLFLCNSCDNICESQGFRCIYGFRAQYNENYDGVSFELPDYIEPRGCGMETSPVQFKLYCGCV